jgi:ankyrin repeat protein
VSGGANVDDRGARNRTPLMIAAMAGSADVARFLIERGADVKAKDGAGETAVQLATNRGHREVARVIQLGGASHMPAAALEGDLDLVRAMLDRGDPVNAPHEGDLLIDSTQTPLHNSALGGHADIARLLLERGADVEARNYNKETPLWIAARQCYPDIVELLLAHGARTDVKSFSWNVDTLRLAQITGCDEAAALMLKAGAQPSPGRP